jgi:hypothetical protein
MPREIHQQLEDFSQPYRFHVVVLASGLPKTYCFSPLELAKWVPTKETEIVGIFENPANSRILHKSLESHESIFLDQQN